MKILFLGTSDFAVSPLEILIKNSQHIDTVITQPDKLSGRGKKLTFSPVKQLALKYNLNILQPENVNCTKIEALIKKNHYDIGIVISYGQIIKKEIFSLPKFNIINLHPSLLPRYRGPSPIQTALLNGDKITGNTIIKITEKMDAGPVLMQKKYAIKDDDNYFSLHNKLSLEGGELLTDCLKKIEKKEIVEKDQCESSASYCKLITKEDGLIKWNHSSYEILNKIKALCNWPVAYTFLNNKILKIYEAKVIDADSDINFPCGTIIKLSKKSFGVVCGDNKVMEILKVQLQGKKLNSAKDFLNGIKLNTGERLMPVI